MKHSGGGGGVFDFLGKKHNEGIRFNVILALKVILLDRLQGIICSGIQEPYLLGVML